MERVEALIANVKQRQFEENREEIEKKKELDERRQDAVRRIAKAALTHLNIDTDRDAKNCAERRMLEAEKGRLSKAQAFADLAESGDFKSEPWWWNIVEDSEGNQVSLWKGYVKYDRIIRKQLRDASDFVDLNIREKVRGGFVAEVLGNHGTSAAVSEDSPREAAVKAYGAYQSKATGEVVTMLPKELNFEDGDVKSAPWEINR